MKKLKIATLDELEKLVLNPKIAKLDKYNVFSKVLQDYPIVFIEIILDVSEELNGIEDKDNRLLNDMKRIISEIRLNPTAKHYSGLSVVRNESHDLEPPDAVLIDFSD